MYIHVQRDLSRLLLLFLFRRQLEKVVGHSDPEEDNVNDDKAHPGYKCPKRGFDGYQRFSPRDYLVVVLLQTVACIPE